MAPATRPKKKPIETLSLEDLGVDAGSVGPDAAGVTITAMTPPPERGEGTVLQDMPHDEAVDKLFTLLRDEAKAI